MLRSTPRVLAAALAVVALAGCSRSDASSAPSASSVRDASAHEIIKQATANAKAQTSVHIRGKGSCPESAFYADLKLRADGGALGTVRFGTSTVNVRAIGTDLYVQGPFEFWAAQSNQDTAKKIGDKWVKAAKASNLCLGALTTMNDVIDNYVGYGGAPVKENANSVFGVPAVLISLPGNVAIWVSTKGVPVPVRIDDPSTSTGLSLGEWSQTVTVTAPDAGQVVDSAIVPTK